MGQALRKLTEQALALDERDRLALAADLIDSVEGPADAAWASAWSAELDRRVAEADRTGDRGRPWDEVRAELLSRLADR
jgi:putative addiction module component (TIGR02574 family)